MIIDHWNPNQKKRVEPSYQLLAPDGRLTVNDFGLRTSLVRLLT